MTIQAYNNFHQACNIKDKWNSLERCLRVYKWMEEHLDLKGKSVLDISSRFGLFSYFAYLLGSDHVLGVELNKACVDIADSTFQKLQLPKSRYRFRTENVFNSDLADFDVILCFGLYYNITPRYQERLLSICRKSPISIIESWSDNNFFHYPVMLCKTFQKPANHSWEKTQRVRQYLPNRIGLESEFKKWHFSYKQLSEVRHGCCDLFYLLERENCGTFPLFDHQRELNYEII